MEPVGKKKPISDTERLELAERLDQELDEYINSLEKRPYNEGWPEDNWQEEMEKHPFFMTRSPGEDEALSPLLQGLQQLKYDETENTPEELAANYKEDGNFHFKYKKYRVAILSYTEGLRHNCSDNILNSQLYNNRSAAHFQLQNYRSCLNDCEAALKLQPDYPKVQMRAAHCHYLLGHYDESIELCNKILYRSPSDELKNLRSKALDEQKLQDRNSRKEERLSEIVRMEDERIMKSIKERGITLKSGELPPVSPDPRVHLEDDHLVWPVIFLYPEYETSDFIQEFHEESRLEDRNQIITRLQPSSLENMCLLMPAGLEGLSSIPSFCKFFQEHLENMFFSPAEWDVEMKYTPNNLAVYWQDESTGAVRNVLPDTKLRDVLSDSGFCVTNGTPVFVVVLKSEENPEKYISLLNSF